MDRVRAIQDKLPGTVREVRGLGLMNAMSGSAFSMATLFALSIQPYINSSIIIQLLTVAIPALERMAKEGGEEGRKKIASITRYTTVAIGLIQGFGYYSLINSYGLVDTEGLPALWGGIVIVLSFTAGSAFLMWLSRSLSSASETASPSSCSPASSPASPTWSAMSITASPPGWTP